MRLKAICAGALLAMLSLTGCPGTMAAYRAADTPDEYAFVLVKHYEVLVTQAADAKERVGTSPSAIRAMQLADNKAGPVIERLRSLRDAYLAVKSADNEAALQAAINDAIRLLADFIRAVDRAGGGTASTIDERILHDDLLLGGVA